MYELHCTREKREPRELNELYDEWFSNKDYWFSKNSKIDVYLCDKYYKYIEITNNIYENYKNNIYSYDDKTIIACIILLDQISRHFKRVYDANIDIIEFSRKAINFSNILLLQDGCRHNRFSIDELSFIYLPYRHLKDIDKIYEIIGIYIELYEKANTEDKLKCRRYLHATLNNIYKDINLLSMKNSIRIKAWEDINKDILDHRCLEDNKIATVVCPIIHENMRNEIEKLKDGSTIIVSLSGGVDSMVALYLCKYIKDTYNPHKIKNIIAIHINYNNREHSGDELDFVNYYCNKLGVKLYFRTIKEISRNNCLHNGLRDLYEDITKNIRYDMYRLNIKNDSTYILLGHNKDDCFENVITNISNKSNYNNLSGMEVLKEIEGMSFWRPLLNIEKRHILDCANINNIPYLYDSTPAWSVRGKIRDTVRPSLLLLKNNEGIEDNSMIDSFFYLRDYIANTQDIFNELIINNLISKIKCVDAENSRKYIAEYSKTELISLKYIVICKIFFSKLNIRYSHKAIKDFCEYITSLCGFCKNKGRKFILSKSCLIDIKINSKNNNYYNIVITG
jgi:tRNA(Ile)-lysidine synthetase-like protein